MSETISSIPPPIRVVPTTQALQAKGVPVTAAPTCPHNLTAPTRWELESKQAQYEQICQHPLQVREWFRGQWILVKNDECSDGASFSKHGPSYADMFEDAKSCAESLANMNGATYLVTTTTENYPFWLGSYSVWRVSREK